MTALLWIDTYLFWNHWFWIGLFAFTALWTFWLSRKVPGLLVLGPLVVSAGAYLITFGPLHKLEAGTVESWPETAGEVTLAEWRESTGTRLFSGSRTFHFRYRYSVSGREFTSERYSLGTQGVDPDSAAVGQTVNVIYNPRVPARAVLAREHDRTWGGAAFMIALGTLLVVSGFFQTRTGWQEWRERPHG